MAKITALFTNNTRDAGYLSADEIRQGLRDGMFYLAGEFEVNAEAIYDDEKDCFDRSPILDAAFRHTQNDVHENPVTDRDGRVVTTLQELLSKYCESTVRRHLERDVLSVQPAAWNGEFAQRSSMVGDLFVIDDAMVFEVGRTFGFNKISNSLRAMKKLGRVNLIDNPWAPGGLHNPAPMRELNEEFDQLLTD